MPKAWVFESTRAQEGKTLQAIKVKTDSITPLQPVLLHQKITQDEARSLQFYLRRSGKMIAKYDHSRYDFWLRTIPRAVNEFESLKHLLVATALEDEKLTSSSTITKIDRRIAYHYQQGLSIIIHGKPSLENVLLNCLVSFYFEAIRGNMGVVAMHVSSLSICNHL